MTISDAIVRMIAKSRGNQNDINHFLKVWAYAKTIGEQEKLDERIQKTLEYAAIVREMMEMIENYTERAAF